MLLVRTMTNLCIFRPGDDTKRSWAMSLKVCKVTKRNSEAREVGVGMTEHLAMTNYALFRATPPCVTLVYLTRDVYLYVWPGIVSTPLFAGGGLRKGYHLLRGLYMGFHAMRLHITRIPIVYDVSDRGNSGEPVALRI